MEYGLQLFSVRDAAEKNFEEALCRVAEIGYKTVEPAGFFGHSGKEVAKMLEKYGLGMPSTHTGLREMSEHFDEVIENHKALGCNQIIFSTSKFIFKL